VISDSARPESRHGDDRASPPPGDALSSREGHAALEVVDALPKLAGEARRSASQAEAAAGSSHHKSARERPSQCAESSSRNKSVGSTGRPWGASPVSARFRAPSAGRST